MRPRCCPTCQTFDLRGAVLTRELRFSDDAGRTTSVTQHRLVAMNQAHVAALETTIVAEDWSGTIEIPLDARRRRRKAWWSGTATWPAITCRGW